MASRARDSGNWSMPGGSGSLVKVGEIGGQMPSLIGVRTRNVGVDAVVAGGDLWAEEGFNGETFNALVAKTFRNTSGESCTKWCWKRISVEREVDAWLVTYVGIRTSKKTQAPNSGVNRDVGEDHDCGTKNGSGEDL